MQVCGNHFLSASWQTKFEPMAERRWDISAWREAVEYLGTDLKCSSNKEKILRKKMGDRERKRAEASYKKKKKRTKTKKNVEFYVMRMCVVMILL